LEVPTLFLCIEQFKQELQAEADNTRKIFSELTDESHMQPTSEDHRTLGRITWYIAQTLAEIADRTGLKAKSPAEDTPMPVSAQQVKQAYDTAAKSLLEQVTVKWSMRPFGKES
jgi:hypothetical protein